MKSKSKIKVIIITLGIIFALFSLITTNLNSNVGNLAYSDDTNLDNKNLKLSKVSGKIHIINNSGWVAFRSAGNCTGQGTYSDSYVIEDLVIDGGGSGSCIWIEDSNVYFKIENCTVYNSGGSSGNAGIRLSKVNNSQLINNNCSSNHLGIYLDSSNNNTISGNIANNNGGDIDGFGIYLYSSNNNTISGNTANNNTNFGIFLGESNYNIVSGNTLIGNNECIAEENCQGNEFSDNGSCTYGEGDKEPTIPGYNLFFLIILLSIVSIIINKKIKKS